MIGIEAVVLKDADCKIVEKRSEILWTVIVLEFIEPGLQMTAGP